MAVVRPSPADGSSHAEQFYFFEGACCGGGFYRDIYIIYNNIIIYYSYIIYVVHSKPTHRSRYVRVVCVDEGRV